MNKKNACEDGDILGKFALISALLLKDLGSGRWLREYRPSIFNPCSTDYAGCHCGSSPWVKHYLDHVEAPLPLTSFK